MNTSLSSPMGTQNNLYHSPFLHFPPHNNPVWKVRSSEFSIAGLRIQTWFFQIVWHHYTTLDLLGPTRWYITMCKVLSLLELLIRPNIIKEKEGIRFFWDYYDFKTVMPRYGGISCRHEFDYSGCWRPEAIKQEAIKQLNIMARTPSSVLISPLTVRFQTSVGRLSSSD